MSKTGVKNILLRIKFYSESNEKITYTLFIFLTGCLFLPHKDTSHHIDDIWSVLKRENSNVLIYKTFRYDEETGESIIRLKVLNGGESQISIKYQLCVVYSPDEKSQYFHKKEKTILISRTKTDKKLFIQVQPMGFAIATLKMKGIVKKVYLHYYDFQIR